MKSILALSLAVLALPVFTPSARADWLGYRGPTQNGVASDQTWNAKLPDSPKILWRASIGLGTSSVTVSGGKAFTMGNVEGKDIVYCFDAASGKELWRYAYPMAPDPKLFEGGPRSTPVVDGDHVYVISQEGDFFCLNAASGQKLWYKHFVQEFGGRRPDWGYAGSPLVRGNAVYCDVGGAGASTVAFEKATGKVLWKAGGDAGAYATPVAAKLGGKESLVVFKKDAVVGEDLTNGTELWRFPWKTTYDVNAATPLLLPSDRLFISSGYNTGGGLFQISGRTANPIWKNNSLRTQINSAVPVDGYLYGIDGDVGGGHLVCVSIADGTQKWQEKSIRGGSLIASNGKLIVISEKGELVICDASPEGFKPSTRATLFNRERCWAQPTLDSGHLFLRSNQGTLLCLDVR